MDAKILLEKLAAEDNLRSLTTVAPAGRLLVHEWREYINLSSNDYLGLSGDVDLQREFLAGLDPVQFLMSNPSSRLITGNSPHYDALEQTIESLFPGRRALVLASGTAANSGIFAAVTGKNDLIIADKLVHASIIDGLKLCECAWRRFNHNEMNHLEDILRRETRKHENVWVVTESLFSMDGDFAPLAELVELKKRYGFKIYLDEAHSFGAYGPGGRGYAVQAGLDHEIDILMATLGKAVCSVGAFVITDSMTREVLVNRMRTLIFATALPPVNLIWSEFIIKRLPGLDARRGHLHTLSRAMTGRTGSSQIVPLIVGDSARAVQIAGQLREAGFWTTAIRKPTVAPGTERIRLSLNAALTVADIDKFKEVWNSIG